MEKWKLNLFILFSSILPHCHRWGLDLSSLLAWVLAKAWNKTTGRHFKTTGKCQTSYSANILNETMP